MAEHTKTPWHWECKEECERLPAYNRVGCLLSEDDTEVLWFGWGGEECIFCPNLADAEFIIQACNAYDADQAEIKRLREALEKASMELNFIKFDGRHDSKLCRTKAAQQQMSPCLLCEIEQLLK
ncbi:MAG: hypothetical protein WC196_02815 [Bacilli bacterium]